MKNNDLLEDLKAFRTPICEWLSAKIPYTDELADYLTDKGYHKQIEGEWVKYGSGLYCSLCTCTQEKKTNFCPNCGAKMKGDGK